MSSQSCFDWRPIPAGLSEGLTNWRKQDFKLSSTSQKSTTGELLLHLSATRKVLKVKPGKCSNIWCRTCFDVKISHYNKAPFSQWSKSKTSQELDLRWAYSQAVSELGTSTSIATGESCKELVKEMAVGRRVDGDDPVIVDDAEPVASICWLGTASFSAWISETSNSSASSSSTELSWLTELS